MDKVLVVTDLHLRGPGKTIIGLDPRARLEEVLGAAWGDHRDAAALICMGDLTHSGRPQEYDILRDVMAASPMPVLYMLGNHDDRAAFGAAFPDAPQTGSGHRQQIVDLPHHRLITLDTLAHTPDPPHAGWLCPARLDWLRRALDSRGDRIPLIFAHHPPGPIGLPGMDAIPLMNGDALLAVLADTGAHLFCGHIHRTISGQMQGVPLTIFKSPCHQAPLDLHTADSTLSTAEPGAYGLLLLTPDGVIVHTQDVGLDAPALSGSEALPDT